MKDLRDELNTCLFCGQGGSFDDPIRWDTWHLPYVSDKFPAHRGCADNFLAEKLTEQEMLEELA